MDEPGVPSRPAGAGWWYRLLGMSLVAYTAACSGRRDRSQEADARERQHAIVDLAHDRDPGNPTDARPEPSSRYTPVMVTLAAPRRATGLDPYDALTGAVVNPALLGAGLRQDLPWHQVNPSAFRFAPTLIIWSLFQEGRTGWPRRLEVAAAVAVAAGALLDRPMTGVVALLGLSVSAVADPITPWQVPSTSRGRIIAAIRYEFLVPDQERRRGDLERFFVDSGPAGCRELTRAYKPRWISIDTAEKRYPSGYLIDAAAVVARASPCVLMNADHCLADGGA